MSRQLLYTCIVTAGQYPVYQMYHREGNYLRARVLPGAIGMANIVVSKNNAVVPGTIIKRIVPGTVDMVINAIGHSNNDMVINVMVPGNNDMVINAMEPLVLGNNDMVINAMGPDNNAMVVNAMVTLVPGNNDMVINAMVTL